MSSDIDLETETWINYQSPTTAFIRLIDLYGWKLCTWKPYHVELFRDVHTDDPHGNDTRRETIYGRADWDIHQWIAMMSARV